MTGEVAHFLLEVMFFLSFLSSFLLLFSCLSFFLSASHVLCLLGLGIVAPAAEL